MELTTDELVALIDKGWTDEQVARLANLKQQYGHGSNGHIRPAQTQLPLNKPPAPALPPPPPAKSQHDINLELWAQHKHKNLTKLIESQVGVSQLNRGAPGTHFRVLLVEYMYARNHCRVFVKGTKTWRVRSRTEVKYAINHVLEKHKLRDRYEAVVPDGPADRCAVDEAIILRCVR